MPGGNDDGFLFVNKRSAAVIQKSPASRVRWPLGLACLAQLFSGSRAHAGNQLDYRSEFYREADARMTIETHSVYFEQKVADAATAKGELIYDGISGSTPTGAGNNTVKLHDIRRAMNLGLDLNAGRQTISPGFAYSKESDYESYGISLNDAISFNDKNTIFELGASHNFDRVLDNSTPRVNLDKQNTEVLVGVSQLLDPKTIFKADFTYGSESGYLTDPYRKIIFSLGGFAFPEIRPGHRTKEVFQTGVTHYFDAVNGSAELSYRFHHDSYGIDSHTAALTWRQKLGSHLILEPAFRYYEQSAADFHRLSVANLFPGFPLGANPQFYSADYRLSHMFTIDYGVQATVIVTDWLHLIAGYHRYEMRGLDNQTAASIYPKANIYTIGISFLW